MRENSTFGWKMSMKKTGYSGLVVEMASLLVVFTAAFLVGESVAGRTCNIWRGMLTGTLAFLGVIYATIWLMNLVCKPSRNMARLSKPQTEPAEPGAAMGAGETAGFLVVFLPGYFAGHFIAAWTGRAGWGIVAGAFTVAGIVVALVRIFLRLQVIKPSSVTASPSSFDKNLAWAEPRKFRKADLAEARKWVLKMIVLTFGAAVVSLCIANWFGLEADATWKLLVNAGGIVVLFLGMLGFTSLMRIVVKITGKAIVCDLGRTLVSHRFGTVDHCEIGNMLVGGKIYPVLVVALKCGDREIYCVDSSVPIQVLRSTLEQRGVSVVTRTDTMSEQALAGEESEPHPAPYGIRRGWRGK